MRILVVGAGAVGGYFGGRLAQAGRDVTFLVREKRAARLNANGLRIKSPHGDFRLQPKLEISGRIGSTPYDVVIVSVKAYGLEEAIKDFAPAVGPETMILPLLNGMHHLDTLKKRFGSEKVLGGSCYIISTVESDGTIHQMQELQKVVFGELPGGTNERVERLYEQLVNAGFPCELSKNIQQDMWEKWVQLASVGGVICLFRGTTGEIEAVPGGSQLAVRLLDEAVAVAKAYEHSPRQEHYDRVRESLTTKGSAMTTSMYRDLVRGEHVEADQIIGDLVGRGEKRGVECVLLKAAYVQLRVYENRKEH